MKKRLLLIFITVIAFTLTAILLLGCVGGGGDGGWDGQPVQLSPEYLQGQFSNGLKHYLYTAEPVQVENDIIILTPDYRDRVSRDLFDFEYKNNLTVGTATVTVKAKADNPYFFGSMDLDFYIEQGEVTVTSAEDLIKELNGDNVFLIRVTESVDLQDAEITVKEGVALQFVTGTKAITVDFCGKLTNLGKIEFFDSKGFSYGTEFFNEGTMINKGKIIIGQSAKIYNSGSFDNENGEINVTGSSGVSGVISNDETVPNILDKNGDPYQVRIRRKVSEEDFKLEYDSVFYNPDRTDYEPLVTTGETGNFLMTYNVEYLNCNYAGVATAHVKVERTDRNYYGEVDLHYVIKKGIAEVTTVAEVKEYQANGNYGVFYAEEFRVEEGETLTLKEDEELNLRTLYVYGTLKNYGKIHAYSYPAGSWFEGNCFVNAFDGGVGRLENYGELRTEEFYLYRDGTAVNYGKMIVSQSTATHAPFRNAEGGEAEFTKYITVLSGIENDGEIKMQPLNYALFYTLDIKNGGKFSIDGETVVKELVRFENGGEFSNENGSVWTYVTLPSDFKNVVLKRQIRAEDIVFDDYPVYDGKAKPAVFAESTDLKPEQYSVKYKYEGESDYTRTEPVDAGKISLFIQITDELTVYYKADDNTDEKGILSGIPYEILQAEVGVSTAQELHDYAENANYARVYLENDIEFTYTYHVTGASWSVTRSFTVANGVTLDTNGFRLTLSYEVSNGRNGSGDPNVTNRGTILNSKVGDYASDFKPTVADCGVYLNRATIYNYGTIVNRNVFLADRQSDVYEYEGSKIENHGLMYLVHTLKDKVSEVVNDGKIFERENLNAFKNNPARMELEYTETDYDGKAKMPWVKLYGKAGEEVDLTDETRFEIFYDNDVPARYCSVIVRTRDEFDEGFVGSWYYNVNVKKGVAKITEMADLVKAIEDSNYIGYELAARGVILNRDVTLPAGTFFDMGTFDFGYSGSPTVDLSLGAELRVSVDSSERFFKYVYCADKITFVSDFEIDPTRSVRLRFSDLGLKTALGGQVFKKRYEGMTVDLNGHTVGGGLNFSCEYDPFPNVDNQHYTLNIIDSGEGKTGRLGSGTTAHGLYVSGSNAINVNLTDVTVGGLELCFKVYFKAENCTFETVATAGDARAAYYCGSTSNNNVQAVFDRCTFNGAVGAYIAGARHIFNDCDINANGAQTGEANWGNGSAVVVIGNVARVGIDGGNFTSENGYCVELVNLLEVNKANIEITHRTDVDGGSGTDDTGRWSSAKDSTISNPLLFTFVEQLSYFEMKVN